MDLRKYTAFFMFLVIILPNEISSVFLPYKTTMISNVVKYKQ